MKKKVYNAAVIGFGLSGRIFHAPFLNAHPGFKLHTIVTSGKEAHQVYPEAHIVKDIHAALSDPEIDIVSICTPNEFHFSHAKMAIKAGKHVILEKPVTNSSKDFQKLITLSSSSNKRIFPFQNRRWDGDFITLSGVICEGILGDIVDFESHFDRYVPMVGRAAWRYNQKEGGGTLFDLGSHLIDQAVCLFGIPDAVYCRLFNQRENSIVDDSFDMKLIYPKLNVTLKAGVFVKEAGPRFIVHGTKGSFVKYGFDPQESALRNGKIPSFRNWATEPPSAWGIIHRENNGKIYRHRRKTTPGNYMNFFEDVFQYLVAGNEPYIMQSQVLTNLQIIEKAILSHNEMKVIKF